jgi:hypothetical protein
MKNWLVGALLLGCAPELLCQTSAYQDASGNTSIYLANAKASLTYNVSSSQFKIGYLYEPAATKIPDLNNQLAQDLLAVEKLQNKLDDANATIADPRIAADIVAKLKKKVLVYQHAIADYNTEIAKIRAEVKKTPNPQHCWSGCEFGINVTGKPSSDLGGQILQSGNSPADFGGGFSIGKHGLAVPNIFDQGPNNHFRDDWLLVNVSYDRSTFDTVATGSSSTVTQHFNGFTVLPVYNALINIPGFTLLGGIGAGVNRTNNSGTLKKVEVSTTQSGSGTTSVVSQTAAFQGAYQESIGVPVYSDFVFIPHKLPWLAIDAFERSNVATTNRYAEGGVGLFFAKPSNPTAVLGGLSISWKDGTPTTSIVAGWSF